MFGSKKIPQNTASDFLLGRQVCGHCHRYVSFDGQAPLSLVQCPLCNEGYNFVPMRISRFWLFAPLGGGGMGSVYKALIQDDPDHYAAVKILPRDRKADPILTAGLQAESSTIEQLGQNPCIVSGLGSGFEENEYFLAMQFMEGERLDKLVQRLRRVPELDVILIGLRLLQAETHIYNQGFLFRDMKPENVIVNDAGAHLFDYGICIRIENTYTDQGDMVSGSPIYWPPERVVGEIEGCSSEIYSLGMVLYHAAAGEPYFQAKEIEAMARKHVRSFRVSDYDQKMKKIRPDLANVIMRMISREPQDRYQSFAEVEAELVRILNARLAPPQ